MKSNFRLLAFAFVICSLLPHSSDAAGNDNPTGVTGEHNGSITTGGSYDPYTGNAKRFVTDLTVTGGLGAYPLKWTRALNTRGSPGTAVLGHGGVWRHSYQWGMWVRPLKDYHYYPNQYEGPDGEIDYPDGRKLTLKWDAPDGSLWVEGSGHQELDRIEDQGDGNYDLLLADGGRVKFQRSGPWTGTTYGLYAREIVDPHGQRTILTRDDKGRLSTITEPGGRYLEVNYITKSYQVSWPRDDTRYVDLIGSVQSFPWLGAPATETVYYDYGDPEVVGQIHYWYLKRVDYADETHATYTYYPSSSGPAQSAIPGSIWTCSDVRFAGPMKKIEYVYATGNDVSGGDALAVGQIKAEKNPTTGEVVSEVIYPKGPFNDDGTEADSTRFLRTEKRGDGRQRTFQYSWDGHAELKTYTDFKGQTSEIRYEALPGFTSYRKIFKDARGKETWADKENNIGAIKVLTHPGGTATVRFEYTDAYLPYYLSTRTDERGKTTRYTRYPATHQFNPNMVERIDYPNDANPNASWESFTYNAFNQVRFHRLTNGATEEFTYDTRGLKQTYVPPPTTESDPDPGAHPTRYFYYTSGPHTDRLQRA